MRRGTLALHAMNVEVVNCLRSSAATTRRPQSRPVLSSPLSFWLQQLPQSALAVLLSLALSLTRFLQLHENELHSHTLTHTHTRRRKHTRSKPQNVRCLSDAAAAAAHTSLQRCLGRSFAYDLPETPLTPSPLSSALSLSVSNLQCLLAIANTLVCSQSITSLGKYMYLLKIYQKGRKQPCGIYQKNIHKSAEQIRWYIPTTRHSQLQ